MARAWNSDRCRASRAAPLAIGHFVRELAATHREAIADRWPKLLRRVGGYNLDIFQNQSERPYTGDGHVNLAHLLIGSEGTLAYTKNLTLRLSALPRSRVLGVVNFPSFRAAMRAPQQLVKLGPSAVELVDGIMIELGLANPSFRPLLERALIGKPAAILLVEFSGDEMQALESKLADLITLMGDMGLPGSVVAISDPNAQQNIWEVRKAGLNIMMSLKGDGKPVSFIEDCAVPLEHLAEYTDALTDVFERHGTHGTWYAHASVGTLHVRPILDMRQEGPTGGAGKMRAIAEEAAALVRKFRGAYSGEHGDGLCRGEWIEWQFGPSPNPSLSRDKRRTGPYPDYLIRARSSIRRKWTIPNCFALRRLRRRAPIEPYRSSRCSTGRLGMCKTIRSPNKPRHPVAAATIPAASPKPSKCATTTATAASSLPAPCAQAIA